MPDATDFARKITSTLLTQFHERDEGCEGDVYFFEAKRKLSKYQKIVGAPKGIKGFLCTVCDMQWDEKGEISKDDYRYLALHPM